MNEVPRSRSQRTWGWSLLIVASVHVLAIGSLYLHIVPPVDRSTQTPAIAIEMAPPVAAPAPVHDTPTPRQVEAPQQQPQPRRQTEAKKLPFAPPPEVSAAAAEVMLPPKKDDERPPDRTSPMPAAPATTDQAAPDLPPDTKTAALVNSGAAPGQATEVDLWDARVLARIELTKRYPSPAARQNQQDDVDVALTMDREGTLLTAKVRASRGFVLLDDAALDAVRRAAPFPKPPKDVEGDPIRLSVTVRFFKKAGQ